MPDQDRDNQELLAELEELRARLEEAEETLRAIQEGEVDAVVVSGPRGEQVYSLSQPLQEHLHFLQTLIDAIPNPVYYKGVNRLFLGCNRAFADYSGLTKEEIVGKTAEDLYPPDLAATYTKSDQELLDRPGVLVFEAPTIAADGSRRQVIAHKTTFTNVDGAVGGILGVLLDITERKQAEEALAASARKWQITFEAISDAICLLDNNFKILQCNRAMMDLLGKPADEIIGGTCWKLVHGTDGPIDGCPILRMKETLRPEILILPQGDRWLEVSVFPVLDEAGGLGGAVHIISDITAAKQAEEQLLRLNRLYSLMLKINEVIVRIRDLPKLYQQVCRLAVEEGMFRMAWVGLVEPETRCVKPVAHWGFEEGYLDHIRIAVDDVPEGRGPSGTCIRAEKIDICNDVASDPRIEPWREESLKRGYRSSAAFPLKIGNRTVGALNLYAGMPQFFTPDQVQLLESLCADLSFALEAAEREEQRRQAEADLRRAKDGLEDRVAERTVELRQANELLTARTHDLEQRHREATLLSKLSEVLQSRGPIPTATVSRRLRGVVHFRGLAPGSGSRGRLGGKTAGRCSY